MPRPPNFKDRELPDDVADAYVAEYLLTLSKAAACRAAGRGGKYASTYGSHLHRHPKVAPRIEAALREKFEAAKLDGQRVLRELWDVLMADPNDLVEHRRVACRYCHGVGFRYQRTVGEMERDRAGHARSAAAHVQMKLEGDYPPFDERGGVGYDPRREPHEECPECFGEGDSVVFVKDTRDLSPAARALLAGVKQTKEGIEIKMHSKDKAVELLGKHLALFNDKLDVNLTGDLATRILKARGRGVKNDTADLA